MLTPTTTYEKSFQDPNFVPPLWWVGKVYARCPKCLKDMELAGLSNGGSFLNCTACTQKEVFPTMSNEDLAKKVFERLANPPKP
jgi:hypothetical protein